MSFAVVGRDAELASVRDFLSRVADGAAALALEGDAGVGKTTVWEAGLEEADAHGFRVLTARPAESETALSFSGIGDLLDPVLDEALAPLSAAQRRALSRALALDDDEGPPPEPYAIGVAVLNSFRALAESRPLVVAVDDEQWLDPASAGGLGYAVRRLRLERVGVLLTRRSGPESSLLRDLRRALSADRMALVDVTPLDAAALHQVVQSNLGVALPRPRLDEVREASGGNPFYALEIVRMLERTGVSIDAGQRLPVPESLHDLVHERLLALPMESRAFLLAPAAYAHATVDVAEAATGIGRDAGLRPALEARIVELDRGRIRFIHPLLASGVYEAASRSQRLEAHKRLAELLDDPEARAWQLAASVESADEAAADALEEAARHAKRRGALGPAALMLERASELTPSERADEALRRAVDAAYLHFESGDSRRAERQLRTMIEPLDAGPPRARALLVLARIRLYEALDEAAELFTRVLEEAGDDRETLAVAHEGLASCCAWTFGRFEDLLRHSARASTLAEEVGDDALAADVVLSQLSGEALLGRASAATTALRAEALQDSAADQRVLDQPLISLAEYWTWVDEHERARDALVGLMRSARDLGDENARPWLCFLLGDVERLLGSLESALDLAREGHEAAEQSGQRLFADRNLALEALVSAQLGRPKQARQAAQRAFESQASGQENFVPLVASEALGHLELSMGRPDEAVPHLEPQLAVVRGEAIAEPGATRFVVDLVEALLELGRTDEAVEALDWYEGNARRLERASARANCLRCRGLLAAQGGDLDRAIACFTEALTWHERAEIPLDRGRTLLALGVTQRRARRRRDARVTLERALTVFTEVGAARWGERARAELRRISGRAPTAGALTPAEERVALLVAEGRTNREVATALFLSDRTVEGHLSRVFGKLGIQHRTELQRALSARQSQGIEASNTVDSPVSTDSVAP
jgi:DNA-binding CsgD family transcriptional regulator